MWASVYTCVAILLACNRKLLGAKWWRQWTAGGAGMFIPLVLEERFYSLHRGVKGHTVGSAPWLPIEDSVIAGSARIVGAKELEVTVMNSLTVNIHLGLVREFICSLKLMMLYRLCIMKVPFYKPTPQRYKILMEERPFPSDLVCTSIHVGTSLNWQFILSAAVVCCSISCALAWLWPRICYCVC